MSSAGGFVREGDPTTTHEGTALTYLGAAVDCHACGATGRLIPRGPRRPTMFLGKDAALDGNRCACQCSLRKTQCSNHSEATNWRRWDSLMTASQSRADRQHTTNNSSCATHRVESRWRTCRIKCLHMERLSQADGQTPQGGRTESGRMAPIHFDLNSRGVRRMAKQEFSQ
ncbi:PAAR domain-containing protein [Caballeronia sp. LZ025]